MMGYGYGMGAGGWIAMTIFWVGLITLIIWALARALPSGDAWGRDSAPRRESGGGSAEDILDRRFAAGELDEETYRSMRATLRSSRATQNEPR
jgi:putative membrane protein